MSEAFVLSGRVQANAAEAVKELSRLTDELADQKIAMRNAQEAVKQLSAEHRKLQASEQAGGQELIELTAKLKAAERAQIEQAAATARATAALNNQRAALGQAAVSTGQMKAASTNLGQQLGDVAQGLALGTSPATIFAQQAGQVAFALQGMGGAATGVAKFLGGPWGTALTLGLVVLSPFIGKLFEGANAAGSAAMSNEDLRKSLDLVTAATRVSNASVAEGIKLARADADAKLEQARKARDLARDELLVARAQVESARQQALGRGSNFGLASVVDRAEEQAKATLLRFAAIDVQIKAAETAVGRRQSFSSAERSARIAVDPEFAIREAADQRRDKVAAAGLGQAEATRQLIAINREERAGLEALRQAQESATEAKRDGIKATKEAASEEKRRAGFIRDIAAAINDAEGAQAAMARRLQDRFDPRGATWRQYEETTGQIDGAEAAGSITPQQAAEYRRVLGTDTGKEFARIVEGEMPEIFGDAGKSAGQGFNDSVLNQAVAIGQTIGGVAGGLIRSAAGIAQGLGTGNFTGVGGQLGGLLTLAAGALKGGESKEERKNRTGDTFASDFRSEFKGAFTDLKDGFTKLVNDLGSVFKGVFRVDGDFGKMLGSALGTLGSGAAVGASIADIGGLLGIKLNKGGAAVGGAIGGALGSGFGPIGKALGSVIGSIAGGLIKPKNPYADVALTSSADGVSGNVFASRKAGSAESGLTLGGGVNDALARAAEQLGASIKPGVGLGSIGFSGDKFYFNRGGGDFKGAGAQIYASAEAAVSAAVAAAFQSGALEVSPRIQAALGRYGDNIDKAVAEALKVKDLEDVLTDAGNPFARMIRDFERQAAQRLDVARRNGFDIAQIEKLNGDERRKIVDQALQQSVGSAKALLDDLRFGNRAEGSFGERRAALLGERDRLQTLVNGGDQAAGEKLVQVLQQLLDVSSEGYGATGVFASDRAGTVTQLEQLIRQREAQIEAAATAAKVPDPQLSEANASLDDLVTLNQRISASLAQIAAQGGFSGGGGNGLAGLYARELA